MMMMMMMRGRAYVQVAARGGSPFLQPLPTLNRAFMTYRLLTSSSPALAGVNRILPGLRSTLSSSATGAGWHRGGGGGGERQGSSTGAGAGARVGLRRFGSAPVVDSSSGGGGGGGGTLDSAASLLHAM